MKASGRVYFAQNDDRLSGIDRMSPTKILMIRHAEEHATPGFTAEGQTQNHSLTVRGWQRAGALAQFFRTRGASGMVPDVVFASGIGSDSESHRPHQTVAPLVEVMRQKDKISYCDAFLKLDADGLMADVMTRTGTVLIAWEHSRIPDNVAALPNAPKVPSEWPADRYDLVWILVRNDKGWTFDQVPQHLLVGDCDVD